MEIWDAKSDIISITGIKSNLSIKDRSHIDFSDSIDRAMFGQLHNLIGNYQFASRLIILIQ